VRSWRSFHSTIRKAYKWAVRGEAKLPTLAAFIRDVKLAIGSGVLERQRLLVGLVTAAAGRPVNNSHSMADFA
jgi:hypothetical protein